MKLTWDDKNKDRGVYKLTLTTDEGSKQEITLWDYASPYRQKQLERDFRFNANFSFGFVVSYCHGYSMEESFPNTWTLEQVKKSGLKIICSTSISIIIKMFLKSLKL